MGRLTETYLFGLPQLSVGLGVELSELSLSLVSLHLGLTELIPQICTYLETTRLDLKTLSLLAGN